MKASCCCGAIRFARRAAPTMMATCHCSRCRKVGAGTFVFVRRGDVDWLDGRDEVATYAPEPPCRFARCFCRRCGTALGELLSEEDSFPIPAHLLDDDPGVRNRFHEFVTEKPDWVAICDGARQFARHPLRD